MPADPVVALLPVTQADREAAASVADYTWSRTDHTHLRNGMGDRGYLVQAFARHRLAHRTPAPAGDVRELQQHFERMQDMMRRYIEPCTYVASFPTDGTKHSSEFEEPGPHDSSTNAESKRRRMDRAFISDMIYMMDGPEQRALGLASPTPDSSAVSGSAEGLREALKPFAALASYMAGRHGTVIGWDHDRVTYDDFRNAAAALAALTEGQQS